MTELRTQALDSLHSSPSVPTPGVEPGLLANRASVLPVTPSRQNSLRRSARRGLASGSGAIKPGPKQADGAALHLLFQRTGSGRGIRTFTLRFQRPACCQLHHPGTSTNGETRTRDLLVHSQTLYPAKLRSQPTMAGMERLELSKPGLKNLLLDRFAFIPVSVRRRSVCRWFPTGSIQ